MKKDEPYKSVGDARSASGQNASHNASVGDGSGKQAIEELRNEVLTPLQRDIEKLRDPVVLAAIMHTAATEKENTNRLLKTLIERLDASFAEVDERLSALERKPLAPSEPRPQEEVLLPTVDEEILKFVKEKRFASAEEVRRRFGYKGKNAASARLNRMFELGLLAKRQVGRAVVFSAKAI
ncbi:MAG: hypothetical protein V1909_05290 [Candidatus Micrarchaeota archaeon]